ncbi:MAG: hypothetical protein ACOH2L_20000 [Devosia sp.]
MNSTAIITNAPTAMNRRLAMQSIAAVGVAGLVSGSLASDQVESTAELERLIAFYEAKEAAHVELLDMEEVYSMVADYPGKSGKVDEVWAGISKAVENADEALLDVFRYTPANVSEAFAKARFMFEYKASINGDWRDCEIAALISSTTDGWLEV